MVRGIIFHLAVRGSNTGHAIFPRSRWDPATYSWVPKKTEPKYVCELWKGLYSKKQAPQVYGVVRPQNFLYVVLMQQHPKFSLVNQKIWHITIVLIYVDDPIITNDSVKEASYTNLRMTFGKI